MNNKQEIVEHLTDRYSTWMDAIRRRDIETVASIYAENAVYMPPGRPRCVGRAAIREAWAGYLDRPDFAALYLPSIEVSDSLDMAYDVGRYVVTLMRDGKKAEVLGKYVVVWEKVGSEWAAVVDIDNTDHPV